MTQLEEGSLVIDRHLNGILKIKSLTDSTVRMGWGMNGEGKLHPFRTRRQLGDVVGETVRFKAIGKNVQAVEYAPYAGDRLWTDQTVEGEDGRFDVKSVLVKGENEKPVALLLQQTHEYNMVLEEDQTREIYVDMEEFQNHWEVIDQ